MGHLEDARFSSMSESNFRHTLMSLMRERAERRDSPPLLAFCSSYEGGQGMVAPVFGDSA